VKARKAGLLLSLAGLVVACGKKGPPLPPLIRLPVAPAEFRVARQASDVILQFTVPDTNADGSKPAELSRVDVYALNGASTATVDEVIKRGTKVGIVKVNRPPDPDEEENAEASSKRRSTAAGDRLDQGAVAYLTDAVAPEWIGDETVRLYVAIGINEHGRRGRPSRAAIPLVEPPAPPEQPTVDYDEKKIQIAWMPPADNAGLTYVVYAPGDTTKGERARALTEKPVDATKFDDARIEWGAERCYVVRSMLVVETLAVESEASPETCVMLMDMFPPAAPSGLQTVSADGAVDLFWDANTEPDVAGYNVFRAIAPDTHLLLVTPSLLAIPGFRDTVPRGARITYAIQAVDTAGNESPLSAPVEETAR
jgi:hypothetical protein